MASVRQRPHSRFWYACVVDADGRRRQFSTGLDDKAEALAVAVAVERSVKRNAASHHQLVTALERIAKEYTPPEDVDIALWFDAWVAGKRGEITPGTLAAYRKTVADFKEYLSTANIVSLSEITEEILRSFRSDVATRLSPVTANAKIKHLKVAFGDAVRQGKIGNNPCAGIAAMKETATKRREFRQSERELLLTVLHGEWLGMYHLGINTGQRLNDLAVLRWRQVDLGTKTATFHAAKTGKLVLLPLIPATIDALSDLPSSDDPDAFVFPSIAALKPSGRSGAFRSLLASVGLARKKNAKSEQKGGRRKSGELCFHSLRHTTGTLLKSAGVSEGVTMAILGHQTKAVSASYTHIDLETMRQALEKMDA